ncbi:MAG TPA: hypothetical protein DCR55_00625 [Lentisphaeria bacterium]|jgi:hypothetical protein|nr:hypothetical protein [Lentisphaeria bacterium]
MWQRNDRPAAIICNDSYLPAVYRVAGDGVNADHLRRCREPLSVNLESCRATSTALAGWDDVVFSQVWAGAVIRIR